MTAALDRAATTDRAGSYEIAGLAAGRYQVSLRAPGFATSVRFVTLEEAGAAQVDAVLRVALDRRRARHQPAHLPQPHRPGRAGERPARPGRRRLRRRGVLAPDRAAPVYRAAEVFEAVPGVVISQHSGEGKANQYYVRGFNIDHGTDLASFVAGVPVNMPSHGHGQGYSDNNFLVPELVSGIQYQKGTYSAEEGDFSAAGAINVNYLNVLDRPARQAGGRPRPVRARAVRGLLEGGRRPPAVRRRGVPQRRPLGDPDDYRKLNGILRYRAATSRTA